ncbi:MAG: DNA polymerase III subunit alpha, partial [Burkholderiaceae bacterium]
MLPDYAELLCRSNFSFLTGASSPEELVDRAAELRYSALAITDECSLSGVVHAHERATEVGLHLIVGAEMRLEAGVGGLPMRLVLLATTHRGYSNLSQWISLARRRAEKGRYEARASDVEGHAPIEGLAGLPDCLALLLPTTGPVRIGAQVRPSPQGAADEGRPVSGSVPSPAAAASQSMPSSQSVIAIARARAAATIATNKPGAGRPGGRAARQMRDGAAAVDPAEPVTDTPEGAAPAAQREAKPPPMLEFVNRPSAALPVESLFSQAQWLKTWFGLDRGWLALPMLGQGDDDELRERVKAVSRATGLRIVAVGDVLWATHSATPLQDVLTATRLQCSLAEAGHALSANAEAHLRGRARLRMLFDEAWMAETMAIAGRCKFSLSEIKYTYPQEIVPKDHTPASWLRQLTEEGAVRRFGANVPDKARRLIEHELALIGRLKYEAYFLTVADIVRWARSRRILCQGRGSAANSAVCYCLGVTEVDPDQTEVLFERFISEERGEPPDIDIDFEHQRREEVIQYIYDKYGRHRAALTGVIIRYRTKSAVRDVGRALGVDLDRINAVTRSLHHVGGSAAGSAVERLALSLMEHGFDPDSRLGRNWIELSMKLRGQPRHLSQHPGGFLIAREDVARMVPVENAAMDGRTVIQWDKDDLDVLGLLKVDILALGMLSALKRAIVFVDEKVRRMGPLRPEWLRGETADADAASPAGPATGTEVKRSPAGGRPAIGAGSRTSSGTPAFVDPEEPDAWSSTLTLEAIPKGDDPAVFAMLSAADSVGVFQVESRAQIGTLPRLRPRRFYDLAIEIALIRPGPIQGGAVHPYIRRATGRDPVSYVHPDLEPVLGRTLGVPLFQEQLMEMAVAIGDCSRDDADLLRRAMGSKRGIERIESIKQTLYAGMERRGLVGQEADQIYQQILSFANFGFAESHALSFALLVYASSWFKLHYPAAFLAGLLRAQPMGFYSPQSLVQDARRHGVEVLRPDITRSGAQADLEVLDTSAPTGLDSCLTPHHEPTPYDDRAPDPTLTHRRDGRHAVRLGLDSVRGIGLDLAQRIVAAREERPFADMLDLSRRAGLDSGHLEALATAGAFEPWGLGRRE